MSGKLSSQDKEFAYAFLINRQTYHNHKEQMAYVAFLVQTAFFTAIMTFSWDFEKAAAYISIAILAVLFWILIHFFLRWQLRLRRLAALQTDALVNALLLDIKESEDLTSDDSTLSKEEKVLNNKIPRCVKLVDRLFWPCPVVLAHSDIKLEKYPKWFQKEFKSQVAKGTGASTGEIIVTLASWLILFGIIARFTMLSVSS